MEQENSKKSLKKFLLTMLGGISAVLALLVVIGMFAPKSTAAPFVTKARQALKASPWADMSLAQSGENWAASVKRPDGVECNLALMDLSTGDKTYISINTSVYASQTNIAQGMAQVSNAAAVFSAMYPEDSDSINKALSVAPAELKKSLAKATPKAVIPNTDNFEVPFGTIILTGGVQYPFGDRSKPYDYHISFYKNIK